MQKNILKKITVLIYLAIFLFSLFVPFNQSFAENPNATNRLVLSADLSTIKQDMDTRITAEIYATKGEETVSFSATPILGTFTPGGTSGTCTTPKRSLPNLIYDQIDSCSILFRTGATGPIKITASIKTNGITYLVNLPLKVCKPSEIIVNNVCTNPVPLKPETSTPVNTDTTYTPLAPLPGLGNAICKDTKGNDVACIDTKPDPKTNPCPFGNYLNIIIKLVLGIAGVLAMVMIVMGGIQYMTSDLISSKEAGKETIQHAILGLLLALGAFLILNTINPKLLSACLDKLPQAKIVIYPESAREYKLSQTQTTDTKFKRTSYYDKIKTASATNNIPNCLLQVAIQRESGGVPNQIGHDENVPLLGVPSRKTFVNSGIKYDKTIFTPSTDLITKENFKNNDSRAGLDWRFSHSVGLFGVTFGPNHGGSAGATEILNNIDKDIEAAVKIMREAYEYCGKNIEKTFRRYHSGSCDGGRNNPEAFVNKETPLRKSLYDQCVTQEK